MMIRKLLLALLLIFITRVPQNAHAWSESTNIELLEFRLSALVVNQPSVASWFTYTPQFAWAPVYILSPYIKHLEIRVVAGYALLRNANTGIISSLSYQGFLAYTFLRRFELEAGGGGQTWIGFGTHPIVSGNLHWILEEKAMGLVDRIFAGYSKHFITIPDDQYQLGIGMSF